MYLVAIIDWFSRYVVAWQLSNTLDGRFCVEVLERALRTAQPAIFNTDSAPVRAFISAEIKLCSLRRGELLNV
jgi:transposase InsO family protein